LTGQNLPLSFADVPAGRTRREESRFREQAQRLAIRLRVLRTDHGLTQEQLAIRADVAVSTLRKIESGRVVEPGFFTMLSLADALGVELQELTRYGLPHPGAAAGEG
jgi:transcriptional regulator with XRE-family HTH domain